MILMEFIGYNLGEPQGVVQPSLAVEEYKSTFSLYYLFPSICFVSSFKILYEQLNITYCGFSLSGKPFLFACSYFLSILVACLFFVSDSFCFF